MYKISTLATAFCSEKHHTIVTLERKRRACALAQDAQTILARLRTMAERERISTIERRDATDLPSLIERLTGDLAKLLDQKVTLLTIELKDEARAYVRGAIFVLAGAIVAAIGFSLTNIALAFAISTLFAGANLSQPAKYALGFIITGIGYLFIGSVIILITKNRLATIGIVPRRTVAELERDKEWLKEEL